MQHAELANCCFVCGWSFAYHDEDTDVVCKTCPTCNIPRLVFVDNRDGSLELIGSLQPEGRSTHFHADDGQQRLSHYGDEMLFIEAARPVSQHFGFIGRPRFGGRAHHQDGVEGGGYGGGENGEGFDRGGEVVRGGNGGDEDDEDESGEVEMSGEERRNHYLNQIARLGKSFFLLNHRAH